VDGDIDEAERGCAARDAVRGDAVGRRRGGRLMSVVAGRIAQAARTFWMRLREWCGDAAYEKIPACSGAKKQRGRDY